MGPFGGAHPSEIGVTYLPMQRMCRIANRILREGASEEGRRKCHPLKDLRQKMSRCPANTRYRNDLAVCLGNDTPLLRRRWLSKISHELSMRNEVSRL